ncbi:MAG: ABC transporter permease subunit [Saprospiraceae bacterium]|nr:ABC transporter permease subunit [Lewinella sp.]
MNPTLIITKRELGSFFDSLVAYIVLVIFLGFSGFFTWFYGADVFIRKQADLAVFFSVGRWTLFFFIPAITMRMFAEEKRSGTIELLLTKAVSSRQVVLGKFLACLGMVAIALAFTLPYYFSISRLGEVDHGVIWSGYFGLLLMSAVYIAIGLWTSSITNNQIVAFLLALFIGIFFHLLFDFMAAGSSGFLGELFSSLSMSQHVDSITRGVLDSKDLVYFLSLTGLGLLLTELNISKKG